MPSRSPRYYLPAEPFRNAMIEWLARQYKEYNAWHERAAEGDTHSERPVWSRLSPVEYLEIRIGCSRAWVDKFLAGKSTWIPFDMADKLLCAMHMHWRDVPEFTDMYYAVDLRHLDKVKPLNRRRHNGGRVSKWPQERAVKLFKEGLDYAEIAKRLSTPEVELTPRHIRELISRRGLLEPLVPTYDRAEAIRLHDEEGLTWREVGERLGVSTETVRAGASLVKRGLRRVAA